ncbi:MAG: DUF455 family protein [Actinomycetota bacterium]
MSGRVQLRIDAAVALRRFFHYERALTISCGAWVSRVRRLETKAFLARTAWEGVMTANALRERVFELRYPERDLDTGVDRDVVRLFDASVNAPGPLSFLAGLREVFLPALLRAYDGYLDANDDVADGPTRRFLDLAAREKRSQIGALARLEEPPEATTQGASYGSEWAATMAQRLDELGGASPGKRNKGAKLESFVDPGIQFRLPDRPARDDRYFVTTFYWPDNFDPGFPYGDGWRLRIRSAVSHLNEVWAVDTAGAILHAYADGLGWEFLHDAARWLYDESRHMMMGSRRLDRWGFEKEDVPLGSYIYEACSDNDPIFRLGMLSYFETKNIGKKRDRATELGRLGDSEGQRDMDFDWADEAIHAGYGRKWMRAALAGSGRPPSEWDEVVARCEELVRERVAMATEEEKDRTRDCAGRLLALAEKRFGGDA